MSKDLRGLIFEQSTRHVAFYKTLQFFLLTWLVSGALFPEHPMVETMMRNNAFAVNCMFVLSGLLTHLRYRPFFDAVFEEHPGRHVFRALPTDSGFKAYVNLRILAFLPVVLIAMLWSLALLGGGFLQILLSLSLTSSLFSFYPIAWAGPNSELVMASAPMFLVASCMTLCWLIYPFACGSLMWLNAAVSSRQFRRMVPLCVFGMFAILVPVVESVVVRSLVLDSEFASAISKVYLDHTTLLGAAGWLMNPLFKLPLFLSGVAAAEVMYAFEWTSLDSQSFDTCHWAVKWVVPFVTDAIAFLCCSLFNWKPADEPAQTPIRHVAKWLILPTSLQARPQWTMAGPYYSMPLVCIGLLMFGSPFASRGITWRVLCQDPIMAVLPGRTGVFLSFFYTLVLKSYSESLQQEILGGAGLLLVVFCFFVTSVPAYYYIYQPWHIWLCLRCADIQTSSTLEEFGETSTVAGTPADIHALSDTEEAPVKDDYKVIKSPNYDPYFLDDEAKEIKLYHHLDQVKLPSISTGKEFIRTTLGWFRAIFIDFHYVN